MKNHIITKEDFEGFTPSMIIASTSGKLGNGAKRLTVNVDVLNDKLSYIVINNKDTQEVDTFEEAIELYNKP